MKFSGKVGNEPVNKRLNVGDDPNHRLYTGNVFWICHCWEIQKVVTDLNLEPIRQMAGLISRHW